jgi:hypothetical protein
LSFQLTLESCKIWYVDYVVAFSIHPTHGKGSNIFRILWSYLDGEYDVCCPTSRLNALGCEFVSILIKLKWNVLTNLVGLSNVQFRLKLLNYCYSSKWPQMHSRLLFFYYLEIRWTKYTVKWEIQISVINFVGNFWSSCLRVLEAFAHCSLF